MKNTFNPYITTCNPDDVSTLFSISDLSEYLGVGRNAAYRLVSQQISKGFRIGATWKVSKAAVDQYIMKNSGLL